MSDPIEYEVVVVGGGPAGLTTALYTTRLGHRTAVFEQTGGRHAAVAHVHNLVGVSEDVSGSELAAHGARQVEEYGGDVHPDSVTAVETVDAGGSDGSDGSKRGDGADQFRVEATHATALAECVVFATGFADRGPFVPGLERFTGRGLHYCLHCDAYTLGDRPAFVMGHDDHAAEVAMLLLNFTDDVDLLLDDRDPTWSAETDTQVAAHPVERVDRGVVGAFPDDEDDDPEPWLGGLEFADGSRREYAGGFAVYGTEYNADLAADLGCELDDDGAVTVDEDGATSVDGAYAVGDVTHGQNQTPIAMGDGARAGIAIHKELRRFPLSAEAIEARGGPDADLDVPGAPGDLRARMRRDRARERHAGLGSSREV